MPGTAGRDQRGPMERLVRLAAVLKAAGADGVSADKLLRAGEYAGDHASDLLGRDLRHLRDQGWQIDTLSAQGDDGRYRMVTVDNRLRVRLTPEQQTALQRAVILADRADLVERLGLPASEQPSEVGAALAPGAHDERLSAVLRAVRHRAVLRFRYGGKDRVVHPESVRAQNEQWYLRGVEDGGDVLKAFVVARMSAVTSDPPGTARAVDAEPGLALHPMRFQVDPPIEVTLSATAEHQPDVRRWLGEPLRTTTDGDRVEMTYEVTNRAAMRCRLYELGPRVTLVGPEELRDELLAELAAAGRWALMAPKYVERISRLPGVFEHLLAHPDGMPLRQLAHDFHVDPDVLREDLLAFYAADVAPDLLLGLMRPGVLEFLGPDGDDEDPAAAEIVKISDPRSIDELGVEHVDASELALIYTAATSLLDVEPDNDDLAAAIDALSETMLGDAAPDGAGPAPWNRLLEPIAEGQRRRVRVDIVYSRAWEVGVSRRTIEPYRLVRTRRGWEVDAGPLDDRGTMRTFLLSNIRAAEAGDETFELPDDLERRLEEQRATTLVRVEIPQSARWAADMYAEQVTVIDDRETTVELELDLLPPLEHRLGLLMLAAGPDARVLEPGDLADCHVALARRLAAHHATR